MEFKDLIQKRRSVRAYEAEKPIPEETLEAVLKEMQQAPTWKNSQTGRYYVVTDPENVALLRETCLPPFNQKSTANASAYVVTSFVKNVAGFNAQGEPDNELGNEWGAYDLGCQNTYLILAAADRGIDSLIMGIRDEAKLRQMLDIPDTEELVAVIALGYRSAEPAYRPRKPLEEIIKKK